MVMLIFSGCGNNDPEAVKNESKTKTEKINGKDSINKKSVSGENVMEGIYTFNENSGYFRSCLYPDSTYLINDETKKLKGLYEKIYSPKNVYGSVFLKIKGESVNTADEKIKDKYPRSINVSEVLIIEKKNSENTCISYDFWATGNNPGWSLQISKNEGLIEFSDTDAKKIYYCFYEEPVESDGKIIYAAHNNIQRYTIQIVIRKEKCTDASNGKDYEYSAEVTLSGGKIFKGCCLKGKD